MRKTWKPVRILTLALALILVLSALPVNSTYAATATEKEQNNTAATANAMKVNTVYSGKQDGKYSDDDWYKITTSQPGWISVNFTRSATTDYGFKVEIIGSDQKQQLFSQYLKKEKSLASPKVGIGKGTYYVHVYCSDKENTAYTVKATFTAANNWEREGNDTMETGNPVTFGSKTYGSIGLYSDHDFFKIVVKQPGYITANFAHQATDLSSYVKIFGKDKKTQLLYSYVSPKTKSQALAPLGLPAGTYYMQIDGATGTTYNFTMNFKAATDWEREPNANVKTALPISLNKKYYGSIADSNDEDFYKLVLSKQTALYVAGSRTGEYTSFHSIILKSDGKTLLYDTYHSDTGGYIVDAKDKFVRGKITLNAGTYYVKIRGASGYGSYNFSVNTKIVFDASTVGVDGIENKPYTGKAVTQDLYVSALGKSLREGRDYTVKYANNVKAGTATITLTGKGEYAGSIKKTFKIVNLPAGTLTRIYGANRYETAEKISTTLKKMMGVSRYDAILVANGTNYPDALTGAYLAKVKKAPLIMTSTAPVHEDQTVKYIKANLKSGGTVYLLGGEGSIRPEFVKKLSGFKVVRLGAANRYGTNLKILEAAAVKNQELLVCTGADFPDALIASATGRPMMIVAAGGLTKEQAAYLTKNKMTKITVIGNTASVPKAIETELKKIVGTKNVERISATTKYRMSAEVAIKYFKNPQTAVFASAESFPDALAGGPLAIKLGAPLLLVNNNRSDFYPVKTYARIYGVKKAYILGGPTLVEDLTVKTILVN
ncbi:MAG: cell wall-binding repeat-containing protein [Firmicutes bacterium]|nr:cell wall-binding repeat-containing protein [Bacillota bacterium]